MTAASSSDIEIEDETTQDNFLKRSEVITGSSLSSSALEDEKEEIDDEAEESTNEASGAVQTSLFPMARVKKIMKADPELTKCTNESVLAISFATEMFVDLLTTKAANNARQDTRRILKYEDVARAVIEDSRLSFLSELIPIPITQSEAVEKKASSLMGASHVFTNFFNNPSISK